MSPVTRAAKRTWKMQSLSDIYELAESFTVEDGRRVFKYTSFSFIDNDFNAYVGQTLRRKLELKLDDFNDLLHHIPDQQLYPELPGHFTPAPTCIDCYHIKGPRLSDYEELKDHGVIPKVILDEMAALECLSATPHPNIVKYHGCIAKRGRVVGIVLDKYASTLEHRVKDPRLLDKKLFMDQVKSAIDHIHSSGLAHNDINPSNIMLNENDTAFIIDFGSCRPVGENLVSGGTPGWVDEAAMYYTSEQSHDLLALSKLQEWVNNPTGNPLVIAYEKSF